MPLFVFFEAAAVGRRVGMVRRPEPLSLSARYAEGRGGVANAACRLVARQIDGAVLLFELYDVVLQGEKQSLGVFGSQHNAALDVGLGHSGEHADEVHHKLGAGVRDDGQVGIDSVGHFGRKFDFKLPVLGLVVLFHR